MPGSVAPAAQRYASLVARVGDAAELHLKDLEVYREAAPPADYAIQLEIAGIDRFAESMNLQRFHLLAYSGGGFVSLAYAGTRPDRVLSLSLFEPAELPGEMTPDEITAITALKDRLKGLDGPEFMAAFVRAQLKPGVEPPPPPAPGPVSAEMQKRPAGIRAMLHAFDVYEFRRERLRESTLPVFLGYGDLTYEYESVKAGVLAQLFADIRVRRFAGIHHFVPPEQIYTGEHVTALLELWRRAEARLSPQLPLEK